MIKFNLAADEKALITTLSALVGEFGAEHVGLLLPSSWYGSFPIPTPPPAMVSYVEGSDEVVVKVHWIDTVSRNIIDLRWSVKLKTNHPGQVF